ncbi:methionyl-tRNA formyltransferase [Gulosibacter molinativorax]|uniref:Methionyl-tRNA formyltransferase n=1 Tax=Gulosibacter molinativorax TaxID=256821 RepID=A0ABT7C7C0_9MICO|nr:methionyl-tRNA formyltransferase [Gulosibacter molinativorax]MDJ1371075.1 methionyl-tRNA formyltransferase [Gulosibacter molinativorax]QUY61435.1 Methionyl-tRNA formyltransferase [Gulosibacter molinativorax]
MRIAFAGTPDAAVPTLEELVEAGHELVAVITREDAPVGRKRRLTPSAVGARAQALGLPIIKANRIDDAVMAEISALEPELGVVVAYGGLIREPLLSAPKHGWINLHFSLLPKWRGAAPVQRAVMAGDSETGVAVFQLEAGLDTGPTFVNRPVAIEAHETAGDLLERLSTLGVADVVATVAGIADGSAVASPQQGEPSHAAKLETADGVIDWQQDAKALDAQIRGVTPDPGASTTWHGERFKIHRVAPGPDASLEPGAVALQEKRVLVGAGAGTLELVEVQPAGKRAMAAGDWFRGVQEDEVRFG